MDRPIKFRFWDKKNLEYASADISINGEGFLWHGLIDVSHRFVAEQFTGLHDKNGVEVFEGDLIKRGTPPFQIGPVEWGKGGWVCMEAIRPFMRGAVFTLSSFVKETEVIGNIHEPISEGAGE